MLLIPLLKNICYNISAISCNQNDDVHLANTDESENIDTFQESLSVREESFPENTELIRSEKHFQIYEYNDAVGQYFYCILDSCGNIVISETVTRPLSICLIEDDLIDISIAFGTGICQHRYYNAEKIFCRSFF